MTLRRKIVIWISLIFIFVLTAYGSLKVIKYRYQKEYLKRILANAVYENEDQELQKKIIAIYEERIGIDFPESTKVLFANASKGGLLDSTYSASLKMGIDVKDNGEFETYLASKCNKASSEQIKWLYDECFVPSDIWTPKNLKECKVYNVKNGLLGIGIDDAGNVLVYLSYGTI